MSDRILTLPAAKGGLPDTDPEASPRKTTTTPVRPYACVSRGMANTPKRAQKAVSGYEKKATALQHGLDGEGITAATTPAAPQSPSFRRAGSELVAHVGAGV